MDGLVAKGRDDTFTGHFHHLINMEGRNWFVGYIIHDHMAKLGQYVPHQTGDSRGGPWQNQLGDLTFLDHLHNAVESWGTQDNRPLRHARIVHHYGNLVIIPLDTGHFDVHHDEPNGLHRDAT